MTREARRRGLLVIGALAVVVIAVAIIATPVILQTIVNADFAARPAGTDVVLTTEQLEAIDRAEGFTFWGPALLLSVAALAVAIFVVALRWPEKHTPPDDLR